jgi:hypothetical protein
MNLNHRKKKVQTNLVDESRSTKGGLRFNVGLAYNSVDCI